MVTITPCWWVGIFGKWSNYVNSPEHVAYKHRIPSSHISMITLSLSLSLYLSLHRPLRAFSHRLKASQPLSYTVVLPNYSCITIHSWFSHSNLHLVRGFSRGYLEKKTLGWSALSPFRPSDLLPLLSSLHPLQGLLRLTCSPLQPRCAARCSALRVARQALFRAPGEGGFGRGDEQLGFFLHEKWSNYPNLPNLPRTKMPPLPPGCGVRSASVCAARGSSTTATPGAAPATAWGRWQSTAGDGAGGAGRPRRQL